MPAVPPELFGSTIVGKFLDLLGAAVDDPRSIPTTAVIVAHPDDEVIGAGARLPPLRGAIFVHATDGAPRGLPAS